MFSRRSVTAISNSRKLQPLQVVAADDGVMPQTIEAANHALAAKSAIIVAITKTDIPGVDIPAVHRQLRDTLDLLVEPLGGDVQCVEISAKTGHNVPALIEAVLLQAELLDLRADPAAHAEAVCVESVLDRRRGPLCRCIVRWGTARVGDFVVVGTSCGKIRALEDSEGRMINVAGPSEPVALFGLDVCPPAGSDVIVVESEAKGRAVVEYRKMVEERLSSADDAAAVKAKRAAAMKARAEKKANPVADDADGGEDVMEDPPEPLNVILKAGSDGSLGALKASFLRLDSEEVPLRVIHSAVGNVTYSDLILSSASEGAVFGFDVKVTSDGAEYARRRKIHVRLHRLIHEALSDMRSLIAARLAPTSEDRVLGSATVLQVIQIDRGRKSVAGCRVQEGTIARNSRMRVRRGEEVVYEGTLSSLKQYKDDAVKVEKGQECGLSAEVWNGFEVGDKVEAFEVVDLSSATS